MKNIFKEIEKKIFRRKKKLHLFQTIELLSIAMNLFWVPDIKIQRLFVRGLL